MDEVVNSKTNLTKYLTFFVDDEQYGIDISKIREIIAPMHITPVPKTPEFLKGVVNLRGSVIPIVDVRLKFGMDEREIDIDTAIIIYESDDASIGFIVDQVEDVLAFDNEHISEAPHFGANIDTSFIESVADIEGDVIMILNLEKILDAEELLDISQLECDEKHIQEEK